MAGDSTFLMGSTHSVCEDYAQHDEGFALVSDGCSSAPRSDVAARLVYLGARRAFHEALKTPDLDHDQLRALDLRCLAAAAQGEALYATFFCARVLGPRLLVTAVGDGTIVLGRRDSTRKRLTLSYPRSNAPYYPAYALDPTAEQRWREAFPDNALSVSGSGSPGATHPLPSPWLSLEWDWAQEDLDFVLLASDGAGSFLDASGAPVDEESFFNDLCAFKNRAGRFLERRVLRLKRDLGLRGIPHRDDFASAILTFD